VSSLVPKFYEVTWNVSSDSSNAWVCDAWVCGNARQIRRCNIAGFGFRFGLNSFCAIAKCLASKSERFGLCLSSACRDVLHVPRLMSCITGIGHGERGRHGEDFCNLG
jgi:hypothetical protein